MFAFSAVTCSLHTAVVFRAAALFQARQACKVRMLRSEVKEVQTGTLALVQLGGPPSWADMEVCSCAHVNLVA